MSLPFIKMHGAGNDFVIIDARTSDVELSTAQIRQIASRANRVTHGCDQLIVLEPGQGADVFMRIFNADGGEVDACGNATRCVGWMVMEEKHIQAATVKTNADVLRVTRNGEGATIPQWQTANGLVCADMGTPRLGWKDIPLSQEMDTKHVKLEIGGLSDPVCVSMGNPHVVFFVHDANQLHQIEAIGAALQIHPLFPKGVNVSIALVDAEGKIHMRVWERGVGLTASCGTAACAVEVAATRRGLLESGKHHTLMLENGKDMQVLMAWQENQHVFLHGPVQVEFAKELSV